MRPCEWLSEEFMVQAGFKDEFDAYVHNADLEDFVSDKRRQYYYLIDSFARFTKVAPLWNSTSSVKIFKVHGI